MDLRFSEQQEMMRHMAREFLSKEFSKTKIREIEESKEGYSAELWQKIVELGWTGLMIPDVYGGMGYSFQDLTVLLEEAGRNILPGPFFCNTMSTLMIIDAGSEEQKKEFLPKVANGELIITSAIMEQEASLDATAIELKATRQKDCFILNGNKFFVEMANIADYIVCAARTEYGTEPEKEITIFIIDAKNNCVQSEVIPTIGMDKLCQVQFNDMFIPQENILGEVNKGWPILKKTIQRSAIAKCAESLGAMEAIREMTTNYSKERIQYDKPIGSFQALQHIMANMWIAVETCRYLVYEAAWMESEGLNCNKEASMAKAFVNEAYREVAQWGVRLHGAIGTSRDHDMSLYYRRSKSAESAFGGTDYHREIVCQEINLV